MWNLFVYGEKFTDTQAVSKQLAQEIGLSPVTDGDVITWADQRFHMGYAKLLKALIRKSSPFENLTHTKQRTMAYLRYVLAENLGRNNSVYTGLSGHLLPRDFPHVYRIYITADTSYRLQNAFVSNHLPERQALREIHREDESAFRWCRRVYSRKRKDSDSYHFVLPTHVLDRDSAVQVALSNFRIFMQRPVPEAQQAIEDFQLAATVEVLLAKKGYPVRVKAEKGNVIVTIERSVMFLSSLTAKLTDMIKAVNGVEDVQIAVSPNFNQADLCCHTTYETSLETQLSQYEDSHAKLRKRSIAALPDKMRRANQRSVQSNLHLRTMG